MTKLYALGVRMLCLALCLVCLLACVQPVAAWQSADMVVTLTSAVHSASSVKSFVIGRMENGTVLRVLEERGDFYKIDCYDMTGYILKSQVKEQNGVYTVNCKRASDESRYMNYTPLADALMLRHAILATGKQYLGTPYVYGGSRPGGFDCSGFTSYVFAKHDMPIQRSADYQIQDGVIIPRDALQVGDLVFFRTYGPWYQASHVGIYAGNGQFIHSASGGVMFNSLDQAYYADSFLCARRMIHVNTAAEVETVTSAASGMRTVSARTAGLRTAN